MVKQLPLPLYEEEADDLVERLNEILLLIDERLQAVEAALKGGSNNEE